MSVQPSAGSAAVVVSGEHEAFYAELTARNRGLIDEAAQRRLRTTRFVVAGCGSTGGACVMPLVRSGAERFVLLDPGAYELNNLNRQEATLAELGMNKAAATAKRVLAVNPHISVEVHEEGVLPDRIASILRERDFVIDAVDVTTEVGMRAKVALHVAARDLRLHVLTAYDIATTQYVELFDYRKVRLPLRGKAKKPLSPDRLLRSLVPPLAVPREMFAELLARAREPGRPFPQLAMTSTMLGALVVPYVSRVLAGRPVKTRLRVDLHDLIRPTLWRLAERIRRTVELVGVWWRLRGRS
jgi:hypothetical protein